ncbi:MAG TPA: putative hydro-lyase [Candidatus Sulfotelmatobacter sp.]|nr:putative hydro-lyase [Candidatus Sulfotelmatobacter sp.]
MDTAQPTAPPDAIRTDPRALRRLIRAGGYAGRTGGLAMGYVQANLCILPAADADDFLRYCQRNPKPCPLLAVGEPGDPRLPALGADLDVRSDVPSYRVWRDGALADTVADIGALWRDDLVAFALGCSYSFEEALLEAGLPLRHVERGMGPARYTSSIPTVPAGRFGGAMVVTMRSFRPADAIRAIQVTSRFPAVHGAPVHIGLPHLIGIDDLARQCESPFIPVPDDEIPLFWACGVTPQVALRAARPALCITHTPAHMLVTDLKNASLAAF